VNGLSADNFPPSIIDNTPSRKLAGVIKDQLKKSKETRTDGRILSLSKIY